MGPLKCTYLPHLIKTMYICSLPQMWCTLSNASSSKLELFDWIVKIHEILKYKRSLVKSLATSGAVSAYYQGSSEPVVLNTKNVKITNLAQQHGNLANSECLCDS